MDERLIAIPLILIALSAITLWYAISAKGAWWFKLLLIVLIPAAGLYAVRAISSYQGYPTSDELPLKGHLLAIDVREPNKAASDPGVVHLWVRPLKLVNDGKTSLLEYDPKREPRAYRLPYSRKLHEKLQMAGEMIKAGVPVLITNGHGKGGKGKGEPGIGEPGEGRDGPGGGNPGGNYGGPEGDVQFYRMPEIQLPPKDP